MQKTTLTENIISAKEKWTIAYKGVFIWTMGYNYEEIYQFIRAYCRRTYHTKVRFNIFPRFISKVS